MPPARVAARALFSHSTAVASMTISPRILPTVPLTRDHSPPRLVPTHWSSKRIETPVCLDESALSLAHVQAAIRLGSCKVVKIKMARVGGLTASRDIQALCAEHEIPCWVGGMLESAIGGAICAELATLPNFTYAGG